MENYDRIIANGGLVCYNSLASRLSHFKSGGNIDVLLEPTTKSGLIDAYRMLAGREYLLLGALSNTLIGDGGIRGVVLTTKRAKCVSVTKGGIYCLAGDLLSSVAGVARTEGLTGMEELSGIPGTVGGAIFMNGGAYGRYMSDVIEYVDCMDGDLELQLAASELEFGYRNSIFQRKPLKIVGCKLRLNKLNKVLINNKTKELTVKRRNTQPDEPSLGCVFKKVGIESAGVYIERAGLKGVSIGGATVSQKHANFIVNNGGAMSRDYRELAKLCADTVEEKYGIALVREVLYIGEN